MRGIQPPAERLDRGLSFVQQIGAAEEFVGLGVEFLLGDAGLLEIDRVPEILAVTRARCIHRTHVGIAAAIGDAHRRVSIETIRVQQHRVPRNNRAPVVTNQDRRLLSHGVDQSDDVSGQMMDVVVFDRARLVRFSIAAHVGGDDVIAGSRERRDLVTPGIPGLREAVDEDDERPLPHLRDAQLDPVGLYGAE